MPMPVIGLADDAALDDVERGKQRGGPVPVVVVRVGAAATGLERQTGLRAIQRLDLAPLIDAQHHGILRRGQVDGRPHP